MEDFIIYYTQGLESCRKGDFKEGIEAFSKALQLNPSHVESLYNRAKAKFKLQLFDDCIADLTQAAAIAPSNPVLFSERAVVYYHKGLIQESLQDLDMAVELEPENPYRYASRAYIKDKSKDFEGALADYNKAVELDPNDAISHNNKGLVEEKLGYHNRSKTSFKRADELTGVKARPLQEELGNTVTMPEQKNQQKVYSLKDYYRHGKNVLTTKEGLRDFFSFIIDLLKKPKP